MNGRIASAATCVATSRAAAAATSGLACHFFDFVHVDVDGGSESEMGSRFGMSVCKIEVDNCR